MGTGIGWNGLYGNCTCPPWLGPNLKLLPAWSSVPSADSQPAAACLPVWLALLPPSPAQPAPVLFTAPAWSPGGPQLCPHVCGSSVLLQASLQPSRWPSSLPALSAPPSSQHTPCCPGLRFPHAYGEVWRHDLATRFQPAEQETDAQCHCTAQRAGSCPRWVPVPKDRAGPPTCSSLVVPTRAAPGQCSTQACPVKEGQWLELRSPPHAQPRRLRAVVLGQGLTARPLGPSAPRWASAAPGSYTKAPVGAAARHEVPRRKNYEDHPRGPHFSLELSFKCLRTLCPAAA